MSSAFDILEIIARKRDGQALDAAALDAVVRGAVDGSIPDYQLTALLMAIYLRGLDIGEAAALTRAISESGDVLDFSDLGPVVDKHSTGGVGDTVSFIAAPLAAACGAIVPMISGRALAHTGGTLDKLEAIPGLRTAIDPAAFRRAVAAAGVAIVEAGPALAPGDAVLYRLRDASATIAEYGLIIGSIFGKKLCVSPQGLVMDLKLGRGSLLADRAAARELARRMAAVADELGLRVCYLLTDMDTPLCAAVGNAVEVAMAISLLRGQVGGHRARTEEPPDPTPLGEHGLHGERLLALSITVAGEMLAAARVAPDPAAGRSLAVEALESGRGLETFRIMVEAQGGDPRVVDDPAGLPAPAARGVLRAARDGYVTDLDARGVGAAAALLGVGRGLVGAEVDPAAGVTLTTRIGERVGRGGIVAELGAADTDRLGQGTARLAAAIAIGDQAPVPPPLDPVIERLGPG